MASMAEMAAVRRQARLDDVQADIDNGTLIVRQMTPAERAVNPRHPERPLRKPRLPPAG